MTVRIPPKTPGATSEVFAVDFRETAPAQANKTMFVKNPEAAQYGGLSVGVPGEILGFEAAHGLWGNLSWDRLVKPSVDLAKEWTVDVELARRIQVSGRHRTPSPLAHASQKYSNLMLHQRDWSAIFAPEGKLLLENQTIRRTNYSHTLEKIAINGSRAFYQVGFHFSDDGNPIEHQLIGSHC
jgi:gamma-glutamyltranspeptidase/glutathione hydrolase/leukotriene-C4 hydrolase